MKKFFMVALAAMSIGVMQSSAAYITGSFNLNNGSVLTTPTVTSTALQFSANPIFQIQGTPTETFGVELSPGDNITASSLNIDNSLAFTFNFGGKFTFTPTAYQGANFVKITTTGSVTTYDVFLLGNFSGSGYETSTGELNINFRTPASGNPAVFAASGSGSSTVPEPSTYALLGTALMTVGLLRRRKA